MTDPSNTVFSIFAFIGFIISLIPLPWHLQAWNSGTCYYMIWSSLTCLNQFVNSVVWAGNALNPAPIWCDISTRIILGSTVGIPAASLCIMRRLYKISSVHTVTITREEKRRAILVDTLICVLFPLIFIAIQFFVQGHRFNIFEDIGCYPAMVNSLPTYFLSSIWPIIIGLISAVYCVLSLQAFFKRRAQFNQFITSNSTLTSGRYFRLMALAMTEIVCTVPLATFVIWLNATTQPIEPWVGLADAHFTFSRVEQTAALIWRKNHLFVVSVELTRWLAPACAILFFAFFGFAEEARKHYRMAFWAILKPFGISPPSSQTSAKSSYFTRSKLKPLTMSSVGSLPLYTSTSSSDYKKRPESSTVFSSPSTTNPDSIPAFIDIRRLSADASNSKEKPSFSPQSPSSTVSFYHSDVTSSHYRDSMPISPSDTIVGSDAGHSPFPSPRAI